jgi:hypothetical protein
MLKICFKGKLPLGTPLPLCCVLCAAADALWPDAAADTAPLLSCIDAQFATQCCSPVRLEVWVCIEAARIVLTLPAIMAKPKAKQVAIWPDHDTEASTVDASSTGVLVDRISSHQWALDQVITLEKKIFNKADSWAGELRLPDCTRKPLQPAPSEIERRADVRAWVMGRGS